MNVNVDIADDGYNGEMKREDSSDGVIGEGGVGGHADEGDGMMNEGDKSSTTCITMTVFTDSGVVRE